MEGLRPMSMRRAFVVVVAGIIAGMAVSAFVWSKPGRLAVRAAQALERAWLVATGRLVDVGGYRLRIECVGAGEDTVILEAGLCHTRTTWKDVLPAVSAFSRVCTYDRAGLGDSDGAPGPRTGLRMVEEFDTLLTRAAVRPPYVLVGHSFGGLLVRLYAARHPAKVGGIVLVDAVHEDQYERFAELMDASDREAYLQHEGGQNCERINFLATVAELRAAGPLPPVPLVVLSARPPWRFAGSPNVAVTDELQAALARLVPMARHIIAERSGHFIQRDRPELVVQAVRSLVPTSETRRP
jgi:pimeloyl-ACP methyl ester carboxylesterase